MKAVQNSTKVEVSPATVQAAKRSRKKPQQLPPHAQAPPPAEGSETNDAD